MNFSILVSSIYLSAHDDDLVEAENMLLQYFSYAAKKIYCSFKRRICSSSQFQSLESRQIAVVSVTHLPWF